MIGPDRDVKIALDTFEELDRSGKVPRRVLRDVVALLRAHHDLAFAAFEATRQHRFPGTLQAQLEDDND